MTAPKSVKKAFAGFACVILAIALNACSSTVMIDRHDDAIRIKKELAAKYERTTTDTVEGRTLRGAVVELQITPGGHGRLDTSFVFVPQGRASREAIRIPVSDVEPVGKWLKQQGLIDESPYNGVNIVETYNRTEKHLSIRSVPVRVLSPDTCGCDDFGFSFAFALPVLRCPRRTFDWWFVEARGVYSMFEDQVTRAATKGRDAFGGEIAAGVRLGGDMRWGIGLAYSTGIPAMNSWTSSDAARPLLLVHVRYQFVNVTTCQDCGQKPHVRTEIEAEEGCEDMTQVRKVESTTSNPLFAITAGCIRPFLYGQVGVGLDIATRNLLKMNLSGDNCETCVQLVKDLQANGQLPEVNFGMPVTFGFGAGVEMAVASWLDAGLDIGFRSTAIGEEAPLVGFSNVPTLRRVNEIRLRLGLTY
jgi:hypothetical protein